MPIFSADQLKPIFNQIEADAQEFIAGMGLDLAPNEIKELYVEPAHQQLLTDAYEVSTHKGNIFTVSVYANEKVQARARVGGFLVPHYMSTVQPNKESDAYSTIKEWADGIEEVIGDFINLQYCIGYLNDILTEARQFNFFMPSVSYLLRTTATENNKDGTRKYENKYNFSDFKRGFTEFNNKRKAIISRKGPGRVPPISKDIVECCNKADALILRMMLVGEQHKQSSVLQAAPLSRVRIPKPWHFVNLHGPDDLIAIDKVYSDVMGWTYPR